MGSRSTGRRCGAQPQKKSPGSVPGLLTASASAEPGNHEALRALGYACREPLGRPARRDRPIPECHPPVSGRQSLYPVKDGGLRTALAPARMEGKRARFGEKACERYLLLDHRYRHLQPTRFVVWDEHHQPGRQYVKRGSASPRQSACLKRSVLLFQAKGLWPSPIVPPSDITLCEVLHMTPARASICAHEKPQRPELPGLADLWGARGIARHRQAPSRGTTRLSARLDMPTEVPSVGQRRGRPIPESHPPGLG
jgi:hypothetical protein